MVAEILDSFAGVLTASVSWFTQLMTASGATSFYFSAIAVLLAIRFLIVPIFGGSGSDRAKKKDDDE